MSVLQYSSSKGVGYSPETQARAKEDFRVFMYIVWECIGLPEPTEIQYDIAQYMSTTEYDRVIVQGFRGVAKSFISCCFCTWQLWKDPDKKVLIVSASKDRADDNADFIKKIINQVPFLTELKPKLGQRTSRLKFDVGLAKPDASPSVKSAGITGQITGSRADILIADDVEIPNNSGTPLQREKVAEIVKEFDAILKPNGRILYLGTPQNEMSLYNRLQKRGYATRKWIVRYPESKSELDVYGDTLAPFISERFESDMDKWKGKPTDPLRFSEEEIDKRRASFGKSGFSLQFMLNTNLSDVERYPLKVKDLIVTSVDMHETSITWNWTNNYDQQCTDLPCVALTGDVFYSEFTRNKIVEPYVGTVMAIDPSGRGADETAFAVVKYLNGYLFLVDVGGFKEGYSDSVLNLLANKAKFHNVNEIVVESNYGGGMFTKLLTPVVTNLHPCGIKEINVSGQKEQRIIDTLEPLMMRHKLVVNKTVIELDFTTYKSNPNYSLIYQITRISKDRGSLGHDDRIDALCSACAYWTDVMDAKEREDNGVTLDTQLEEWIEYGIRGKPVEEEEFKGVYNSLKAFDKQTNRMA